MIETPFIARAEDAVEVSGVLVHSPGESASVVLLAHGLPSGRPREDPGDGGYPALARTLAETGVACAWFNFRGTGVSGGHLEVDRWPYDLSAVIDKLETLTGTRRVLVFASSTGGSATIVASAADARIAHLVTLAAPADFRFLEATRDPEAWFALYRDLGMIRPGYTDSARDWANHFERLRPLDAAGSTRAERIDIWHGDADEVVPVEHAARLGAAFGAKASVELFPGCGHRLRMESAVKSRMIDVARAWLHASRAD